MTKNQPSLRKTVSTADLYSDPTPPPRHASLARTYTTVHRPRPNPFIRHYASQASLPQKSSIRHSFAGPVDNLIDFDDDFGTSPKKSPTPPPVPPKVKIPAIPEIPLFAERKREEPSKVGPEKYTKPFLDYMTNNPTVFHAVDAVAKDLEKAGYKKLSERDDWELDAGGKYYLDRNGSSLIAFAVGEGYRPGNGAAIVAGHIDALTAKLKPIPTLRNKAGFVQLGVAPYAGALNNTWWDRDLGVGGRVLVKEGGKVVTKLVKLDWPIARIPTLAPHFGAAALGPFNKETQMVPIIGLDNSDVSSSEEEFKASVLGGEGTFTASQPERLVRAIAGELGISNCKSPSQEMSVGSKRVNNTVPEDWMGC
jgi:aminopeptidase I